MTILQAEVVIKGPSITVPKSGLFRSADVAALFRTGKLAAVNRKVVDRGLLAEPHEDAWLETTCANCSLRWPEVLFMVADYACRCGFVFVGRVDEADEESVVSAQIWSAAYDLYWVQHSARHPGAVKYDESGNETEDDAHVTQQAFLLEEQVARTKQLPWALTAHMRAVLGWKVCKELGVSGRFTFAIWVRCEDLIA